MKKRCYVGVAFSPRPGPDLAPPRWPRPVPPPATVTITWVEPNQIRVGGNRSRQKRVRGRGGVASLPLAAISACSTAATSEQNDPRRCDEVEAEREVVRENDALHEQHQHCEGAVVTVGSAGAHLGPTAVLEYLTQMYVKELWGISPINPATTDIDALWTGVESEESSSLALASCLLLSSTSFLAGHWQLSKHYFYLARQHLGELFDVADYDVACVLFPLSWWSRLYADSYAEGLGKQSYYLTLGQNICESVGATNDETYWNFAYTTSHLEKKDPSELVAASKLREPYRRKWKPVRGLTHARPEMTTSIEIRQMLGQLYCAFQPIYTFYREYGANHPGWVIHKEILKMNLGIVNELEEKLVAEIRGDRSCTLMYMMMLCEVRGLRMFILWALQSEQHVYAAKKFVQLLLEVPLPIMVMTTHELTTNDYLLMRLAVDILGKANERELLILWYTTQLAHAKSFYWMQHMCQYMEQCTPHIVPLAMLP